MRKTLVAVTLSTMALIALSGSPVAAGSAPLITFNARDDFLVSPNQANPSGPWSYRRAAPDGSRPLLENFSTDAAPCGPSGEGIESWYGPEVLDLPAVTRNATGSDAFPCGAFVPEGALMAHPGGDDAVAIRWTSPTAGSINVRVNLTDSDSFCGDGVQWAIRIVGQPPIAKGSFPNGGTARVRAGGFHVDEGSRLELKIGPGGSNSCDSTQTNLRIELSPDGAAT